MQLSYQQVRQALEAQGFTIARHKFSTDYIASLFSVDTLIDVGVGHGTPPLHHPSIAQTFVLIDPLPVPTAVVHNIENFGGNTICCEAALGTESGQAEFFVHANMNHSNFFRHTERFAKLESPESEVRTVPVQRLDDVIYDIAAPLGSYAMKIDTEGSELDVLRGGPRTIQNAEYVLIETSIKRRFERSYRPSTLIRTMAELGFELLDVVNVSLATPWYMDLLFAPWRSDLFDRPAPAT
jgi:FkbM family methyltransferase